MRYLSLVLIIFVISIEARSAKTDHAEITIVGNTNIISEPGVIQLGYKFVFTPGWHTYWINPVILEDHLFLNLILHLGGILMRTFGLVRKR